MNCELCNTLKEDWRLIKETKYSFSVICKCPLKENHLLIMPKRHVTQNKFSNLPPEEIYDLFTLVEELQSSLNKFSSEDVILFKNSGKHCSENHLHFHLIPSKGSLRDLFAKYENIPQRIEIAKEEYILMKNKLIKPLS